MSLDASLTWLHEQLPTMERDLASLVEINSFTENKEGGADVGRRLEALFGVPGLSLSHVPSTSGRFADHLVIRSAAPGDPVALVGHLDTVFPPGVFEGYRVDGDLRRGPGVLDMKGGLVVVAYALRALAEGGLLEHVPVRVAIVSDEEIGSPEGQPVIREAVVGADAALVFEAGRARDAIITQRKGTGGITVVATGKAAHAGNLHHEGINAIWALAVFVDEVQRLTDYGAGRTVNVGKLVGGQGKNTVPDRAEALIDIRFTSESDGERLVRAIAEATANAEAKVPGAKLTVTGGIARLPMSRTDRSAALAQSYGACAREEGLGDAEAALLGGGSDASTTSAMGIASIDGLGPRGKGFHTPDEQIEIATLVPKARALTRFLAVRAAPR
jgi:glutamate carboxypeptidase